jgi:cytochrome c2
LATVNRRKTFEIRRAAGFSEALKVEDGDNGPELAVESCGGFPRAIGRWPMASVAVVVGCGGGSFSETGLISRVKGACMIRSIIVGVAVCISAASFVAAQDAAADGEKVYVAKKCSLCHAINGKGNKLGPLDGVGSKLSVDELQQWLIDPKAMTEKTKALRKPIMLYTKMTKEETDALVVYMASLKK